MKSKEVSQKFYKNGYLHKVKIFYRNSSHKYANLFKISDYDMGKKIGSIVRYRHMNFIEKFLFRNCL